MVALTNDAGFYDFAARSIVAGSGYVTPEGHATAFWPVGYPAFLAAVYRLFGESVEAARVANAALDAATAALVYVLARAWWRPSLALLAGGVYAFFPGAIGFTALTLSEPLFTFLIALSLVLLARAPGRRPLLAAAAFGLVLAAATYVRGLALLLPLVAGAWLLLRLPGRRAAALAGVALVLIVAASLPWAVRNSVRLGEPTYLSTNLGQDLRTGHHADATGGLDFHHQVAWAFQFDHLPPVEAELAKNRQGVREAVSYAVRHPREEVALSARKVLRLYRDDADALRWAEHYGEWPLFGERTRARLFGLFNGYYYAAGALALVGLAAGLLRREPWAPLAGLLFVYWTAVHVAFFAEPRFHAPLLPVVSLLAAAGARGLAAFARRGRER